MTAHQNGRTSESMSKCVDLLGVGFGPANLSLVIALQEDSPRTTAFFLEAERDPVWQGGMLLDGSNMQNHPCRDLVTLRNPRSHYSFLNYLFEQGRFVAQVTEIAIAEVDGSPGYVVTCPDGSCRCGRALVLGTGRTPFVPSPFDKLDSP